MCQLKFHRKPQLNLKNGMVKKKKKLIENWKLKFDCFTVEMDGVWEAPLEDNPEAAGTVFWISLNFTFCCWLGRWEEKFGSFTDVKKFGPTSVGVDISFSKQPTDLCCSWCFLLLPESATHVYGIPEHASSLALKSTKTTDPYRL